MDNSWILAGVTLGVFLLFATGGWWVASRMKDRRQRRTTHLKVSFLVVMGVSLAAFAFLDSHRVARVVSTRVAKRQEAFLTAHELSSSVVFTNASGRDAAPVEATGATR